MSSSAPRLSSALPSDPPSERSGVQPTLDAQMAAIDAEWGNLLILETLASSLFAASNARRNAEKEVAAAVAKAREAKEFETKLRERLWIEMAGEEVQRVRCAEGTVVAVSNRMTERAGGLEIVSASGLRLLPFRWSNA